jgi:hypothetical protein
MFLELDADPIAKDINFMINQKCIKSEHKNVKRKTTCKNLFCLGRKKKIKENPKWEQKDLDCCVRRNDVRKELKLFLS